MAARPWSSIGRRAGRLGALLCCLARASAGDSVTGPWDLQILRQAPAATWGAVTGGVQEVYYESVPYAGRPTRVFAYYACPAGATAPLPGIALIHGAGQGANADWASFWAGRGYAALSMDLNGEGPDGRLPDGGPGSTERYRPFTAAELDQTWTYHAVAAVVRGCSLLAAQPGVDPGRISMHGLSLGGCVGAIAASIDDRTRAAALVFGAGYVYEGSFVADTIQSLDCESRRLWIDNFDASRYLGGASCPLLFASGVRDPFFPPTSFCRSYAQAPRSAELSMRPHRLHGYIHTIPGASVEVHRFLDHWSRDGVALPRLGPLTRLGQRVSARFSSSLAVADAALHYTTSVVPWTYRVWTRIPAEMGDDHIAADLPTESPLAFFLTLTDQEGAVASTPVVADWHEEQVPALRITAIQPAPSGELKIAGLKPWGHRVALQSTHDRCRWSALATNSAPETSFQFLIAPTPASAATLYRARDLDW